jgi:hypothetical protein
MKTTDEGNDHWCRLYFVHAMAQMVSFQSLTVEFCIQISDQSMGDVQETKWQWDSFFPEYFSFPASIIPPVLHTHSFFTHTI